MPSILSRRRFGCASGLLALAGMIIGIHALETMPASAIPIITPIPTLLPPDFSILPPFTPAYPCELQNMVATDENLCRYERVQEIVVSENDQRRLIQRDSSIGQGCWTGINVDTHELRVCDRDSGHITTLTAHLASPLVVSPDETAFAFNTFEWDMSNGAVPLVDVYRVRQDGTDLQPLDTQGLPPQTVSAQLLGWSPDGEWLELRFWDGTENGWHEYRLKTDGSGLYEARPASPQSATPPVTPQRYLAEVQTPLRACPQPSCAVVSTIPMRETAPILERFDETAERYWLRVDYQGRVLYAGPFISYEASAYALIHEGRACPRVDCPVRYVLPQGQSAELLWLDAVVVDLTQHWVLFGYRGQEFYLGPYLPLGPSASSEIVIPASETAQALGTTAPHPTPPPIATARFPAALTLVPSYTPSITSVP